MKKLIFTGFLLIILGTVITQKDKILNLYNEYILKPQGINTTLEKNEYYRNYNFNYVQNTDNFKPSSKQDIINIFYTTINSGQENFTFYCQKEYTDCIKDVKSIANDQTLLSHINNFVHPYNGFKHIETEYDNLGTVKIKIEKSYTGEQISVIDYKINEIITNNVNTNDSIENQIKTIHDYIINTTKYDSNRSDNNIINYKSDIAYGPLIEGYGICGGYTDAMELFLEKLNIQSYKISSENHVWNAIYLNNTWYHLDLTWDDPVTTNNTDILEHNYFLINTSKLLQIETTQHTFDQELYSELKEA